MEEGIIEKDMTPKLIGETYLKYPTEKSRQKRKFGLYECQYCGKEFESMVQHVKRKHTKSCGCQKNKQKITHGLYNNRFYATWNNIFKRCNNPKRKEYKDYGGVEVLQFVKSGLMLQYSLLGVIPHTQSWKVTL